MKRFLLLLLPLLFGFVGEDTDGDYGTTNGTVIETLTMPAGNVGDVAVLVVWATNGTNGGIPTYSISDSGDWAQLTDKSTATDGPDRALEVFCRVLDGTETSYTIQTTNVPSQAWIAGSLNVYDEISSCTLDVGYSNVSHRLDSSAEDDPNPPDITTNTASLVFTVLGGSHNSVSAFGAPSGFTLNGSYAGLAYAKIAVATKQQASGGLETISVWQNTDDGTDNMYSTLQTFAISLDAAAPDYTFDKNTYAVGTDDITIDLTGYTETPTATVNGVAETYTGDATGGTITLAITDFVLTGDHESTAPLTDIDVVLDFATETDITQSIQLTTGILPGISGSISNWPSDSTWPVFATDPDADEVAWYTASPAGCISQTEDSGAIASIEGAANCTITAQYFDADNDAGQAGARWSESIEHLLTTTPNTSIPTADVATFVDGASVIYVTFSEDVQIGAGGIGGWTASSDGGAVTLTWQECIDSICSWTTSRAMASSETVTMDYTQPGNGWEDIAGNDLATLSGLLVNEITILPPLRGSFRNTGITF